MVAAAGTPTTREWRTDEIDKFGTTTPHLRPDHTSPYRMHEEVIKKWKGTTSYDTTSKTSEKQI
jgi:hypothetical protein